MSHASADASLPGAGEQTGSEKLNAMLTTVATRDDLEQAGRMLTALCKGEHRHWRMCVPVQPDDSDMILSRVIVTAARYVKLKDALDALETAVKGCESELHDGTLCGEYSPDRIALCSTCARKRDTAIHSLLGASHER